MTERDFDEMPYTAAEKRVCNYLQEITDGAIGCGDDPVGFLIASHRTIAHQKNVLIDMFKKSMKLAETALKIRTGSDD